MGKSWIRQQVKLRQYFEEVKQEVKVDTSNQRKQIWIKSLLQIITQCRKNRSKKPIQEETTVDEDVKDA